MCPHIYCILSIKRSISGLRLGFKVEVRIGPGSGLRKHSWVTSYESPDKHRNMWMCVSLTNFFFILLFSPVYYDPGTGPGLCLPSCMGYLTGVRECPTRPLEKCRIKYNLKGKESETMLCQTVEETGGMECSQEFPVKPLCK